MQAIVGCAIENKPGEWFVQLRAPADNLFDQIILSNTWGSTKEDAIDRGMKASGADEIVEWHKPQLCGLNGAAFFPRQAGGLLAALARCGQEIGLLCAEISKHHDGI